MDTMDGDNDESGNAFNEDDENIDPIYNDHPNPDEAERVWEADLAHMSTTEKTKITEDICGIDAVLKEEESDEKKIQTLLQPLHDALENLPYTTPTYDLAKAIHSTYIEKPDFCAKFLRAEFFDPQKAAIRLNKFLEVAFEFFWTNSVGETHHNE